MHPSPRPSHTHTYTQIHLAASHLLVEHVARPRAELGGDVAGADDVHGVVLAGPRAKDLGQSAPLQRRLRARDGVGRVGREGCAVVDELALDVREGLCDIAPRSLRLCPPRAKLPQELQRR